MIKSSAKLLSQSAELYLSGEIISCFEYQNTAKDINEYMLLHQQGGSKYTERHHYGDRKVPAWCLFHAQGCVNAAPAFQTMNGRKQIYRCIYLVDQTNQLITDAVPGDCRANQCSWKKQEKYQAEQLGDHITIDEMITERFSLPGNQQIVNDPLHISQNIENNKWRKEWNPIIHRQGQRMKCQMITQL